MHSNLKSLILNKALEQFHSNLKTYSSSVQRRIVEETEEWVKKEILPYIDKELQMAYAHGLEQGGIPF